jgi:Arabinofuranosyltransferase N terminal/Arabinofuranosyltransferase A C terminal
MAIDTRPPMPAGGPPPVPERQGSGESPAGRTLRLRKMATNPTAVAVAVWLVTLPIVVLVPRIAGLNPFGQRAWSLSLGAGFAGVIVLLCLGLWLAGRRIAATALPVLAGASAGFLAAWVALTLRIGLTGAPFCYGGLLGDAGRQTALATRFTVTAASTDAWIPGLPGEYPPLFFWLVGRAAVVLDIPAWRLIGDAEVLVTSATVVVGFALWRRLVPPWVALAIAALVLVAFGDPRKTYEVITAAAFVPWALATFGRPPRGRLHWLAAGAIGGLIVLTYQAWLVFGGLGLLALIVRTWRAAEDRRRYVLHLAGVAAVALVVSSWYVVPFVYAVLTRPSLAVSDMYVPASLQQEALPFLAATPLGVLQLVGLGGLVLLRRAAWWATPLLMVVLGALTFRAIATVRFAATGHTAFLHYSSSLYSTALVAAGVLVLAHAAPVLANRLAAKPPPGTAAAALALALAWTCYSYSGAWLPASGQPTTHYSAEAHLEPLPGGGYPRFAPAANRNAPFPTYAIRDAVVRVLGPDPRRVTLSIDERLFAYLPWPGYTANSRSASGSLALWDQRKTEIERLTSIADPARFADASAHTRFGPIDIFVLHRDGPNRWNWRDQVFTPGQFDPAVWAVDQNLPDDVVVAVRR